jgi:hypothetical protein
MTALQLVILLPGVFASGVLLTAALTGRSKYPKAAAFVNPFVFTLLAEATRFLPAPLGAPAYGASSALALAAFFALSFAVTRPKQRARWVEDDVPGAA